MSINQLFTYICHAIGAIVLCIVVGVMAGAGVGMVLGGVASAVISFSQFVTAGTATSPADLLYKGAILVGYIGAFVGLSWGWVRVQKFPLGQFPPVGA